ncbi:Ig-like domain-containing protein [Nocardioides sp. CN2-186]|uniref:Ig-like domain-containing protein n=1 Tax=Nocardioides tweenelious TaxID=3156607 RepID=UPI0032B4407A
MTRSSRVLLTVSALVVGLLMSPVPDSYADYASDCASPTRTLSGGGSGPISLAAGDTLLLTGGDFTGGTNSFPAGATLCVSSSATWSPAYVNNAAGALRVAAGGEVTLSGVAVATGFSLDNEGTFTASNLNINGAATFHNAQGAQLVLEGSFSPGAGSIVNDGRMRIKGSANLNTSVTLENARVLKVDGTLTVNGGFHNSGIARVDGGLTVNGSGALVNDCGLAVGGDLANNGPGSSSQGLTLVRGRFSNNGAWDQTSTGYLRADALTNDGTVTGFGGYRFAGSTATQGTFVGDSAGTPIVVQDDTPPAPPKIFDTQSGTVTNVVAGTLPIFDPGRYPAPGCSTTPPPVDPAADVEASKSAPADAAAGDQVTFTIAVVNHGTATAQDVEVTDALPGNLVGPITASNGGVVAAGSVIWELGDLADGETRTLTVTGTAPASGTLVNTVSSTSSTVDPDPTNNDGTAEAATSTTVVQPPPPTNDPPVAPDIDRTTPAGTPTGGIIVATDPNAGQRLRYSIATQPSNGRALVLANGVAVYLPAAGFVGVDTFDYRVCDNGTPSLCTTATIRVTVTPTARPDTAVTDQDVPVSIPVLANDSPGAPVTTTSNGPSHGSVVVEANGSITYTPDAGYVGDDAFDYTICSPTAPTVCATTSVTVTVLPVNHPPVLPDVALSTRTDHAVRGRLAGTDPDGDALTYARATEPRNGTAVVGAGGKVVYTPKRGYAGHDSFRVTVCDDGDPVLCATGRVTVDVRPVARDNRATTSEDTPVRIYVRQNDDGRPVTSTLRRAPRHGSVAKRGHTYVYRPDSGYAGRDTFRYRVCTVGPDKLCDSALVLVTVAAAGPDDGGGGGTGGGGTGGGGGGLPS